MSVTCLKKGCASHLSSLLEHCLPHTPYDEIVEHAIQFERKQENAKKTPKRKIEEIDLIEDLDNESIESQLKLAKMEIVKQTTKDFANSLKQMKDHVGSKYENLSNELGNKYDELKRTINNISFENRDQRKISMDSRFKPYDNQNRDSKSNGKINACLHCAKPNHRFNECNTASELQKNEIKKLLREKKYDFKSLLARSNKFIRDKEQRSNTSNSARSNCAEI